MSVISAEFWYKQEHSFKNKNAFFQIKASAGSGAFLVTDEHYRSRNSVAGETDATLTITHYKYRFTRL